MPKMFRTQWVGERRYVGRDPCVPICRLCIKSESYFTEYICPKCGHFNPSPRTRHSTLTPQQNLQRPTGPRKSMPPSNVLLHPELAGNEPAIADRRKSMPALASSLSDDVQTRSSIPAHSPLSSVISLPEEDEEGATGDNSIITQTDADISVSVSESAERSTQMEVD